MKKKVVFSTLLMFILFPSLIFAQHSEGGMPSSYNTSSLRSAAIIPELNLGEIALNTLRSADEAEGTPLRYGVVANVNLDIKAEGLKTETTTETIWQYKITSGNAVSLKLFFGSFVIPQGAKLFVYNSDYSLVYGAFTQTNIVADSTFAIADFPGSSIIIEYSEPTNVAFSGLLQLKQIAQAYKNLDEVLSSAATTTDTSFVDVNCSGGINWQLQKHAVCKYSFNDATYSYLCSGALINNINNDGTPYFLTANHCISTASEASTVVAYFNYETKGCELTAKTYETLSGATLLSFGTVSDYTLLKLTTTPTAACQPYYAGWDLGSANTSSVCIHHPKGYLKKIAFDNNAPTSYASIISWDQGLTSPTNTHWMVTYDEGTTAAGSSGSPLFNQSKRIIGQLHGGDTDDFFGKISYSWTSPKTGYATLKSYLAGSSDTTFINGYYPSINGLEAKFSTPSSSVCLGNPVQFTDYSVFNPSSWKWIFTPSTVSFLDGTSKYSQNPIVNFDSIGTYDVMLVVENSYGKDSISLSSVVNIKREPDNNNIASASALATGTNGPFSNVCATVETNEPKPTAVSCFSQTGWCEENSTSSCVLNNSVWFYFYAPYTGCVTIEADNIDGQIALYDADSPENLLNGNYKLLAANDNISSDNTNARIYSVEVTPDKKYWLQFDGGNNGVEGTFYIKLKTESPIEEAFVLFPQPASESLNIRGSDLIGLKTVQVQIYSSIGRLLYIKDLGVSFKTVTVDLDSSWPDGVYIVKLTGDGVNLKRRFIIQDK